MSDEEFLHSMLAEHDRRGDLLCEVAQSLGLNPPHPGATAPLHPEVAKRVLRRWLDARVTSAAPEGKATPALEVHSFLTWRIEVAGNAGDVPQISAEVGIPEELGYRWESLSDFLARLA